MLDDFRAKYPSCKIFGGKVLSLVVNRFAKHIKEIGVFILGYENHSVVRN